MKVLDRYLVRELLIPILYATVTLVFLILIADLFDNLDDLLRSRTPLKVMIHYYLAYAPIAFAQIIAWATWLGALFLLVNLGLHNELVAMKAAGLKIMTIVKPVLFVGFLIGIFTFVANDRLVPPATKLAHELRDIYIERRKDEKSQKIFQDVTYHSAGKELYYFRTFSVATKEVEGAIVLWLGEGHTHQKMVANRGKWTGTNWEFYNVTEYQMDGRGRILGEPRNFPKKIYPEINFPPEELTASASETSYLSYRDLKKSIRKLKENGVRVDSETVDLHSRLAAPWQGLVMMLISVPFLGRTVNRRLIALNVLFCVAIIFAYHVAGAVGIALGKAGKLYPFISAWAANILFASIAFLNLEKANY